MSYKHLSEKERYVIGHLAIAELCIREIERKLNRHHSTISRELRRNDDPLGEFTHRQESLFVKEGKVTA